MTHDGPGPGVRAAAAAGGLGADSVIPKSGPYNGFFKFIVTTSTRRTRNPVPVKLRLSLRVSLARTHLPAGLQKLPHNLMIFPSR